MLRTLGDDVSMLPKLSKSIAFVLLETACGKRERDIYPAPQVAAALPADVTLSVFQQLRRLEGRWRAKEQSIPFARLLFAGGER